MDYKIHRYTGQCPSDLTDLDKKRREKVEKALNKRLSDWEWLNYKQMTMPKSERQK